MNKNILLLTTIYPAPDLRYGSSAIHYFTKEWAKMGHNVTVIHIQAVYQSFFYLIAKRFRDQIASKTGAIVFTKREKADKYYIMDDVKVYRLPMFKLLPHGKYSNQIISAQINKIIHILKELNLSPEIITGHFSNPNLLIINELKNIYCAKTCLVMHDSGESIKRIFKQNHQVLMNNIDVWGYRSISIQRKFENSFGRKQNSFLCYSGIPEQYISSGFNKNFSGSLKKFLYVGDLIKLKNVNSLILSLNKVYPDNQFELLIVGIGAEKKEINKTIDTLKLSSCVKLLGKLPRNNIQELMEKADCFIMISKPEAFGIVYLEAMGKGCFTIGSKGEGIDGIIKHDINGFLCEAGNDIELSEVITYINSLTPQKRKEISQNAIDTTKNLTDYKAALNYIESVIN